MEKTGKRASILGAACLRFQDVGDKRYFDPYDTARNKRFAVGIIAFCAGSRNVFLHFFSKCGMMAYVLKGQTE